MSPRRMKKSNQEKQPQRSNLCQATIGVDHVCIYLTGNLQNQKEILGEVKSLEEQIASKTKY